MSKLGLEERGDYLHLSLAALLDFGEPSRGVA